MRAEDLTFASGGESCAAWHFSGEGVAFAGERALADQLDFLGRRLAGVAASEAGTSGGIG